MISYADLDDLDDDRYQQVQRLIERSSTIWDLPDDLSKIAIWDELIADCERVGFPHLIASSRLGQYGVLAKGGMIPEALDAFAKLMQVIHRHGDLIAPANVQVMLGSICTTTMTLVDDPSIPLVRIESIIDLVEQTMRRRGTDPVGAEIARAVLAASAGDADETLHRIERARAAGSDYWRPDAPGDIQIEIPLIARFDPATAARTLEQRLRLLDLDPHHIDLDATDDRSPLQLFTMLGFLWLRTGRRSEADALADRLLAAAGVSRLAADTVPDYLLPLLENRPDAARAAADRTLAEVQLDHTSWEVTTALARTSLLADPHGEEGRALRALAQEAAAAQDRRGDTDVHTRELESFWWADLPPYEAPDMIDDPAVWGDREERAERILAAGWFERVGAVRMDDAPIALKDRYAALLGDCLELLSVESDEIETAAAELQARADRLRCATSRYAVALLSGLRAGQLGDPVTMVERYGRAQDELSRHPDAVTDQIRSIGQRTFPVIVEQAVTTPAISWERIDDLVATETIVRHLTGGPTAHLTLARAEIAAHRDDGEQLRAMVERLDLLVARQSGQLDPAHIELEVVRLTALVAPQFAAAKARRVLETADAEQARTAIGWLCWFAVRASGDRAASARLAELLAEADGDVDTFGVLPGWVLLEALSASGTDLVPVVDALLADVHAEAGPELFVVAAASSLLRAVAPHDPRGPQLRDRAARLAGALDRRDGTTTTSDFVRDRWFPGDPSFAAAS